LIDFLSSIFEGYRPRLGTRLKLGSGSKKGARSSSRKSCKTEERVIKPSPGSNPFLIFCPNKLRHKWSSLWGWVRKNKLEVEQILKEANLYVCNERCVVAIKRLPSAQVMAHSHGLELWIEGLRLIFIICQIWVM